MLLYDVLIIGNGIIGLSTAYALVRKDPNLKIAILGPINKASSATLAAGAMLGCFGEVTAVKLASHAGRKKLEQAIKAKKLWPAWVDEINQHHSPNLHIAISNGTYILLNTRSGHLDDQNFRAIIQSLQTASEPYQELTDPTLIPGLDPIDDCRPLRALYIPGEGAIDPIRLLLILEKTVSQYPNVSFINDTAQNISTEAYKIASIETAKGNKITANSVVLAAGAYSQALIDQMPEIAANIPRILSGVGCAITLSHGHGCANEVIRTPNRGGSCGLHLVPRENNLSYVGASNFLTLSPETKGRVRYYYYLFQNAVDQLNQAFHDASVNKWYIGNRPVSLDTYPLIGPTSVENFCIATATYREGIHISPEIVMKLANYILKRETSFEPTFLPERPPIEHLNKHSAIEDFVSQARSVGYEHGVNFPKIGWNQLFEEMLINRVKELYVLLGIEYGIPAEILLFLERNPDQIPIFREYYQRVNLKRKTVMDQDETAAIV